MGDVLAPLPVAQPARAGVVRARVGIEVRVWGVRVRVWGTACSSRCREG